MNLTELVDDGALLATEHELHLEDVAGSGGWKLDLDTRRCTMGGGRIVCQDLTLIGSAAPTPRTFRWGYELDYPLDLTSVSRLVRALGAAYAIPEARDGEVGFDQLPHQWDSPYRIGRAMATAASTLTGRWTYLPIGNDSDAWQFWAVEHPAFHLGPVTPSRVGHVLQTALTDPLITRSRRAVIAYAHRRFGLSVTAAPDGDDLLIEGPGVVATVTCDGGDVVEINTRMSTPDPITDPWQVFDQLSDCGRVLVREAGAWIDTLDSARLRITRPDGPLTITAEDAPERNTALFQRIGSGTTADMTWQWEVDYWPPLSQRHRVAAASTQDVLRRYGAQHLAYDIDLRSIWPSASLTYGTDFVAMAAATVMDRYNVMTLGDPQDRLVPTMLEHEDLVLPPPEPEATANTLTAHVGGAVNERAAVEGYLTHRLGLDYLATPDSDELRFTGPGFTGLAEFDGTNLRSVRTTSTG